MPDLRTQKDRAAELASRGKLDRAADLYREVLARDPRDISSRQKLADVLRRADRVAEAIPVFRDVVDRFAKDGFLIKAIAICKTILELDPAHVETLAALAELYGKKGAPPPSPARRTFMAMPAVAPPARPLAEPEPEPDERHVAIPLAPAPVALGDAATPFSQILSAAAAAPRGAEEAILIELEPEPLEELEIVPELEPEAGPAGGVRRPASAPAAPPRALPRVPIFSDLSRDAFLALAGEMVLHRVARGAVVLHEGDAGTSFYVVATGRLAVAKRDDRAEPVTLAHLGEGDFFGEMALLSGAPRAASVAAEEDTELLEFRAEALLALAGRHPAVAASLKRFYRQRLLANAMAVSPVFRPFPRGDRKLVMERFRAREVTAGETVIREGEPSDGLYVILDGTVDVLKRKGAETVVVGRLHEGDLFGEMSCLRKAPATATVVVRRAGTLLRLPRTAFDELVTSYPQILELVSELSDERAESLDAILSGHAEWTEDGLVLI